MWTQNKAAKIRTFARLGSTIEECEPLLPRSNHPLGVKLGSTIEECELNLGKGYIKYAWVRIDHRGMWTTWMTIQEHRYFTLGSTIEECELQKPLPNRCHKTELGSTIEECEQPWCLLSSLRWIVRIDHRGMWTYKTLWGRYCCF